MTTERRLPSLTTPNPNRAWLPNYCTKPHGEQNLPDPDTGLVILHEHRLKCEATHRRGERLCEQCIVGLAHAEHKASFDKLPPLTNIETRELDTLDETFCNIMGGLTKWQGGVTGWTHAKFIQGSAIFEKRFPKDFKRWRRLMDRRIQNNQLPEHADPAFVISVLEN